MGTKGIGNSDNHHLIGNMLNFQVHDHRVSGQYRDTSNLSARIGHHGRFSTNMLALFHWFFDQLDLLSGATLTVRLYSHPKILGYVTGEEMQAGR